MPPVANDPPASNAQSLTLTLAQTREGPPPYTDFPHPERNISVSQPPNRDLMLVDPPLSDESDIDPFDDFDGGSDDDMYGALAAADTDAQKGNRPLYPSIDTPLLIPTSISPASRPHSTWTTELTHNVLQKEHPLKPDSPTPRQAGPPLTGTCAVCRVRPAYNDGYHSYPTCGNACAQKLHEMRNLPPENAWSRPSNAHRTPESSHQVGWSFMAARNTRPTQIKMCEVCHVRPRCERGGKIYPTCGLTCAAKLHPPGSVEMCDFCHQRPKAVIGGKKYPQCGRTCRDKAKLAANTANTATCTTCLICWKATKQGSSDLCSKKCEIIAESKAPFLIEVPRGHVAFKKVADAFTAHWKKPRTPCPSIKNIYMVKAKESSSANYEQYRARVNSHGLFSKKGNEQIRWLGQPRECGFGDPGNLEPCSSSKCLLCSVVRKAADRQHFPGGICTCPLARAVETASNVKKRSSKVVLMAQVLVGREIQMQQHELVDPLPPQGSDSVHLIGYQPHGGKVDFNEIVVYDVNAVKPIYLISLE